MKIKTISRTHEDYARKSTLDITKIHRNRDPALHPFERAKEYTRAVVASKLERIFAKPFVGALDGHNDGVYCMSTVRNKLVPLISGSCDGEVKVWDLSRRKSLWTNVGHTGFVRGVAPDAEGKTFFSCGDDKTIKRWNLFPEGLSDEEISPINTILSPHALTGIDHHWVDPQFATSGDSVSLWDDVRSTLVHSYKWGADSVLTVRFNPAEACLVASTGSDRGVCLYDLRAAVPMRKFTMAMNANRIAWNPREPFHFVLASEDHNLYTFDMRNLEKAVMIHKDHVGAVMDVAFSPSGREFVTGSYDRTVRIFKANEGRSREMYHLKRMQRVFSVAYSADTQYVLSGSDDTNIRIWKNNASQTVGVDAAREERKKNYNEALKRRFAHMPEIKRISSGQSHVPKMIKKLRTKEHIQNTSARRKQENRKRHSREEDVAMEPDRKRAVLREHS